MPSQRAGGDEDVGVVLADATPGGQRRRRSGFAVAGADFVIDAVADQIRQSMQSVDRVAAVHLAGQLLDRRVGQRHRRRAQEHRGGSPVGSVGNDAVAILGFDHRRRR